MITKNDVQHAIRISQVLQDYFDLNKGQGTLRSGEAYEILVKKNVIEKDRHCGIKFRAFLKQLKTNNQLYLIPQCRAEDTSGSMTNWFFQSASSKTIKISNPKPVEEAGKIAKVDETDIKHRVSTFPKLDPTTLTMVQNETRVNYPRAFEIWSSDEEKLLVSISQEIKDPIKLSTLFQRQPSAIQYRLKERFGIIL